MISSSGLIQSFSSDQKLERGREQGTWVAQSAKYLTLDFGSGHDLMVCGIESCVCLHAYSVKPAWDSLSPSCSASLPCALSISFSLSLSQSKQINTFKKRKRERMYSVFSDGRTPVQKPLMVLHSQGTESKLHKLTLKPHSASALPTPPLLDHRMRNLGELSVAHCTSLHLRMPFGLPEKSFHPCSASDSMHP